MLLLLSTLCLLSAPQQAPQPASAKPRAAEATIGLRPGMPAPELSIGQWLKGTPVTSFEKGKLYVVEFWATWCGPCIANMPHLTELQKEYAEAGLTVVSVTSVDQKGNTLEAVQKLLEEKGDEIGYTVAWDKQRATNDAYMRASGQSGIPCAFVIDKQGRIAYIGHPVFIEDPLSKIVAGTWNPDTDPDLFKEDQQAFMNLYGSAAKDPKGTLERLAAFEARHPKLDKLTDPLRFQLALLSGDHTGATLVGARLFQRASAEGDDTQLVEIARLLADPNVPIPAAQRDLALAQRAAERANELTGGKKVVVLETLAKVYAFQGDYKHAAETQMLAIQAAPDKKKIALTQALQEYQSKAGGQ